MQQNELPKYGRLYYDTGELQYEGYYLSYTDNDDQHYPYGKGTKYYKNGNIAREGLFIIGGLLEGKLYYQSGQLKFDGIFYDKRNPKIGAYYGPTYPLRGKYYLEDGTLAYDGEFIVQKIGNLAYPQVIYPKDFGTL